MPKPGRKPAFTERTAVFLRPATLDTIREAADREGVSISHFIRAATEQYIREQEGSKSGV